MRQYPFNVLLCAMSEEMDEEMREWLKRREAMDERNREVARLTQENAKLKAEIDFINKSRIDKLNDRLSKLQN